MFYSFLFLVGVRAVFFLSLCHHCILGMCGRVKYIVILGPELAHQAGIGDPEPVQFTLLELSVLGRGCTCSSCGRKDELGT